MALAIQEVSIRLPRVQRTVALAEWEFQKQVSLFASRQPLAASYCGEGTYKDKAESIRTTLRSRP